MNRNKKKVLATALAVCLVSILSFSTLAWFNASESVTNKFMVATSGSNLDDGANPEDKVFSLDLWEYVADEDGDGTPDKKANYRADGTSEWEYKDVLPGVKYIKQPTVENTGSYDQYIRVIVTVSDYNMFKSVLGEGYDLSQVFGGHDENKWTRDTIVPNVGGDTVTYVYYLNEALPYSAKDATKNDDHMVSLFTDVTLPGVLTQKHMADMGGQFEIKIQADAIQTEGLGDTVTNAKAAFESIGWTADKTYEQAMTP